MVSKEQALDILDQFEFFQGQRAGRELWSEKNPQLQDIDIACFVKHIAELREYITNGSGWISADNPPETYRDEYEELIPFLVCCKGTEYPFRALYDGTTWGDGIGRLDVTHWMPLPEPPKGEKHDPT